MTKEELISAGADYEGGLTLCMNNEEFYFRILRKGLANEKFDSLKKNLDDKNLDAAFELLANTITPPTGLSSL